MNEERRPFVTALAASLLLHGAVVTSPGWGLPWLERPAATLPLEATLALPPARALPELAPAPVPRPRPAPRVRPTGEAPVPTPAAPVAALPPEPADSPLPEETPVTPTPAAAPPAPTPAVTTYANSWPRSGRIRYSVMRSDGFVVGQAEHEWQHDGASYRLRSVTETVGMAALFKPAQVVQESRGIFVAEGLQPLEFRSEREGKLKQAVRFDPSQKSISGGGANVEMREPTQDLLSLFFHLCAQPLDRAEYKVVVATGRKVERYTVTVREGPALETAFGERNTLYLRLPGTRGTENDESTEVWLDRLTHLPLKIRYRDRKGEVFDQAATAVEVEKPQ